MAGRRRPAGGIFVDGKFSYRPKLRVFSAVLQNALILLLSGMARQHFHRYEAHDLGDGHMPATWETQSASRNSEVEPFMFNGEHASPRY